MGRYGGALTPLIALLLAACQGSGPVSAGPDAVPVVRPVLETEPVGRIGDAADDPVILVTDSGTVWLVGTDKQFGLLVYDMNGDEIHALDTGRSNNVDAVPLDDGRFLLAASNRTTPAIDLYVARPDVNRIELARRIPVDLAEPYGLCMSRIGGRISVYIGDKTGLVQAWTVDDDMNGSLSHSHRFASQTEGCVVDARTGTLYVGEEAGGIWSVDLADSSMTLVAAVDDRTLVADVEGLDIYDAGGRRLLIASSQGDSSYAIFALPEFTLLLKFRIEDNVELGIDGVTDTDGVAVTSQAMPGYPHGALVVQDGYNHAVIRNQNFKLVDWRDIAALLETSN